MRLQVLISRISVIHGILQGLKNQFKYRGATETAWDPNTGEMVIAEEH